MILVNLWYDERLLPKIVGSIRQIIITEVECFPFLHTGRKVINRKKLLDNNEMDNN